MVFFAGFPAEKKPPSVVYINCKQLETVLAESDHRYFDYGILLGHVVTAVCNVANEGKYTVVRRSIRYNGLLQTLSIGEFGVTWSILD